MSLSEKDISAIIATRTGCTERTANDIAATAFASAHQAAEAQVAGLVEALKPFAQAAGASAVAHGRSGGSWSITQNGGEITFMDFRRARSALASIGKEGGDV